MAHLMFDLNHLKLNGLIENINISILVIQSAIYNRRTHASNNRFSMRGMADVDGFVRVNTLYVFPHLTITLRGREWIY